MALWFSSCNPSLYFTSLYLLTKIFHLALWMLVLGVRSKIQIATLMVDILNRSQVPMKPSDGYFIYACIANCLLNTIICKTVMQDCYARTLLCGCCVCRGRIMLGIKHHNVKILLQLHTHINYFIEELFLLYGTYIRASEVGEMLLLCSIQSHRVFKNSCKCKFWYIHTFWPPFSNLQSDQLNRWIVFSIIMSCVC